MRSLLFQASLPPSYWVEALHTATYLLNRLPTTTLNSATPFFALHAQHPSYSHLRVFGCKCYPNLSATAPHKLSPRSTMCVFLGYSSDHKGYRCLDRSSNRVIISRHVIFDETSFPFAESISALTPHELDFFVGLSVRASAYWPATRCSSCRFRRSGRRATWCLCPLWQFGAAG